MATVLFVCLHNAGRSQMSQALFERAAAGRHEALSAGSEADPAGHVHPQVIAVMRELGIDLSDRRPQPLTRELAEHADVAVTMGCGDACPYIPGKRPLDWELDDPKTAWTPEPSGRGVISRPAGRRSGRPRVGGASSPSALR
jgi:arsenate reductase (thioredoxin)